MMLPNKAVGLEEHRSEINTGEVPGSLVFRSGSFQGFARAFYLLLTFLKNGSAWFVILGAKSVCVGFLLLCLRRGDSTREIIENS
jgi:hypothetical protein